MYYTTIQLIAYSTVEQSGGVGAPAQASVVCETCMLCVQSQGCIVPQCNTSPSRNTLSFILLFCKLRNLLLTTVKMAASVKYLPHKYGDLSLDLRS